MKNLLKTTFISLLLACSGCVSILEHTGTPVETYKATKEVWRDAVCVWWNDRLQAYDPIAAGLFELTWLVWVVDEPFEVVADTVMLPVDLYHKNRSLRSSANREVKWYDINNGKSK